ncbi:MAG: alanine racemase [Tissierellia bacterium]|nr:alanine racemase [Tissierellia bacterium]
MELNRPAWLEVHLDHLEHNIEVIRKNVADHTEILSIVKADGYGFGAREITAAQREMGLKHFAVATGNEALALRRDFSDIEILILGYVPDESLEKIIEAEIDFALYDLEKAKRVDAVAAKLGKKARVHLVLDTGMSRIGFQVVPETVDAIEEISKMEHIQIDGMFTHFAVADSDDEFTQGQYQGYRKIADALKERDIHVKEHVSNSHAIIRHRTFDLDYVRPGIVQYGSVEGDDEQGNFPVKFVGSLKAKIGHLKELPAGRGVSYGLTYTTTKCTKIATIPIGYADGLERGLSGKIDMLVGGQRCPQIGRICMDQCMIDVTGVDCAVGDEVVIIGKQGDSEITIEEVAEKNGEIPTSYVTHFNKRLPRVYTRGGEVVKIVDQLLDR